MWSGARAPVVAGIALVGAFLVGPGATSGIPGVGIAEGAGLAAQDLPSRGTAPAVASGLRNAMALEGAGELGAAEGLLRDLLRDHPTHPAILFALERVLRAQGRTEEILPVVDRYLEREPRAHGVRSLRVGILAGDGEVAVVEEEIRAWIAADPTSATPYLEASRILRSMDEAARARSVLETGLEAVADAGVLHLALGDLHLVQGRETEAAEAWARAVEASGRGADAVLLRLGEVEGDPARLARPLVRALDRDPTTVDRRRAAVRYALASGLEAEAVGVAETVVEELDGSRLRGFLADLARRGEENGSDEVARWAYRELRARTGNTTERRALDERLASAALEAGDTARALAIRRELVEAIPADSPDRREALAELLELEAAQGREEGLEEGLEDFRRAYPGAPELDGLSARVARVLLGRGDRAAARRVLQGETGPRAALTRAYLLLAEGELEAGGALLDSASSSLPPSRATGIVQLRALLGRLQGPARELVAGTAVLAHGGRGEEAVTRIRDEVGSLPAADRPAVLAHGARTAEETGDVAAAARLRRTLVEAHPDAREAGEAMLELARYHAGPLGETEEAIRLLETLIVERPDAPVVPVARRELERLRRRSHGEEGR